MNAIIVYRYVSRILTEADDVYILLVKIFQNFLQVTLKIKFSLFKHSKNPEIKFIIRN